VVTIAIAGGVALLIVFVTRGSFEQLLRLPIQSVWMVVVALVIQITLAFVDIPSDRFDDLGFALVMVSYGLLLAFCFVNLRVSMMWIIALGIGLNAVVIGLNQGMPARDREVTRGDKVVVPEPVDEVVSIGDIVIGFGIISVFYAGSRVRRPDAKRPSRRAERTAAIRRRLEAKATREPAPAATATPEHAPPAPPPPVPEPVPSGDADDTTEDTTDDTTDDTADETADVTPGVALDQVLARMSSEERGRDAPPETDEEEPRES
jgi:hypothetical protein